MTRLSVEWPHIGPESPDGFHLCSFGGAPQARAKVLPQAFDATGGLREDVFGGEQKRRKTQKNRVGKTIITGALGVPDEARVRRPTLLGGTA